MVKWCFQSSMIIAKTRSYPGANIGSDHELVMMAFRLRLQRVKNQGNIRIRFNLEKLEDPNIAEIFQATIGGKTENQDNEKDALINSFNTAVTETANNILGKYRPAKSSGSWITYLSCATDRENWNKRRIWLKVQNFIEKPTREQLKKGNKNVDRGNNGKTASKNGLALNGIPYYRKPRTVRGGGSWL